MDNESTVYFPCIHIKHGGELNKVTCFVNDKIRGVVKSIGLQESGIEKLITASRNHENTKEAAFPVFVRVDNPNFHGRSYELAFALADKLARYKLYKEDIKYFATGVIDSDAVGKVSKVDGINEKLVLISKVISNNDVVFFSKENLDKTDEEQTALLAIIIEKGAKYFPIEHTKDIIALLEPSKELEDAQQDFAQLNMSNKRMQGIKHNIDHMKYWVLAMLIILIGSFVVTKSITVTDATITEKTLVKENDKSKAKEKTELKVKDELNEKVDEKGDASEILMEPVEIPMDHF